MTGPDPFPVMLSSRERRLYPLCPRAVPWAVVAPHDAQARANFRRGLAALAAAGGLDVVELAAVLADRPYPAKEVAADPAGVVARAVAAVLAAVRRHEAPHEGLPVRRGWVWECPVCLTPCGVAELAPAVRCPFCKTEFTPSPVEPP